MGVLHVRRMAVDPAAWSREPLWLPMSVLGLIVIKAVIAGCPCVRAV